MVTIHLLKILTLAVIDHTKCSDNAWLFQNLTRVLPINYYYDTNNTSSLTKSTFISRTFFFFKTVLLKPIWSRENIPVCKIFSVQELIYMPSIQITIPQWNSFYVWNEPWNEWMLRITKPISHLNASLLFKASEATLSPF